MRSDDEVRAVFRLARSGLSRAEVARRTGIPRSTVRDWLDAGESSVLARPRRADPRPASCEIPCSRAPIGNASAFAYLLGQYLGDGCVSRIGRSQRLRIFCCDAYPNIRAEVEQAITATFPGLRVGTAQRQGCTEVYATWPHWPCVLPHGPGRKHLRDIELTAWQRDIALVAHPARFLRGLIHSDGCRCINRVRRDGRIYEYPRYLFTNKSSDIQALFLEACDRLGLDARRNNTWSISIARRTSVAQLDIIVGPKS